jgi:AcrR family transcriptional regulator
MEEIMRRTKEMAAETRAAILRHAQLLFLERGYNGTSMDDIAAAAGVTRGAVSWHFKNREGLLYAIRDEMRLPMTQLAETLSERSVVAPFDELSAAVFNVFDRLQADPRQRRILSVLAHLDTLAGAKEQDRGEPFSAILLHSFLGIFEAIERSDGLAKPWNARSAAIAFSVLIRGPIVY